MLLQELRSYTHRLSMPPTLYAESPVRYIIDLDVDGRFLGMVDTADPASPATRRGVRRFVPQVVRSSGVKALLLTDKADYVLGYAGEGGNPERVGQCHEAFRRLLEHCATATAEPAVATVSRFLADEPLQKVNAEGGFDGGATITFRVNGVFPHDLPSVQAFWAAENDPAVRSAPTMQCVVCGEQRPVLARLQAKLKGVPGGQTSGTSIISANSDAFESYGLQESFVAPTCADCGERFTKALNELLSSDRNCVRIAGSAFVFWTRQASNDDDLFFSLLTQPSNDQVRLLLERLRTGGNLPPIDAGRFFGCSLSGSGGRAVVRDWIDTTVGEAKDHLARWFARQQVVDPYGQPMQPLGIYALAAGTVRDARKELAPPTPRALLRAALTSTPLPPSLLHAAVRRCQVEQAVTRQRAALIKLALSFTRPYNHEEDSMTALDVDSPSAGYRCGRLLAVLEQAQRQAIPGINQTIVGRFYGTASSAPRSVFPRLIAGSKPHLAKLERDRRGAAVALDRRLLEIMAGIPTFPAVLTLEEQGLFALGYYHQRADDRAKATDARERRRAGQAAGPEADLIDEATTDSAKEE